MDIPTTLALEIGRVSDLQLQLCLRRDAGDGSVIREIDRLETLLKKAKLAVGSLDLNLKTAALAELERVVKNTPPLAA